MLAPQLLQLESSTACDARCEFCPHSTMKRDKGRMSDELFLKILTDAHALGIQDVLLFLNGEPLLFNGLFTWLAQLKWRGMTTTLFTNASQLTKAKAEALLTFSGTIKKIFFSVSGKDIDTHQHIMGLDHDQVLNNIKYFMTINNGRIPCEAHIPYYSVTSPWIQEWKSLWKPIVGTANTTHIYNWAGDISDRLAVGQTNQYCDRLNHMTVLWNGQVALCCMDIEGRVILGNLNDQSILEVFNGPIATAYREAHRVGKRCEKELCKSCNMV